MPELPHTCTCGTLTMVEHNTLDLRSAGNIEVLEGYTCKCGKWNTVFVTTVSMETALLKLNKMNPRREDFRWHFAKALKKARGIRQRIMTDGAI